MIEKLEKARHQINIFLGDVSQHGLEEAQLFKDDIAAVQVLYEATASPWRPVAELAQASETMVLAHCPPCALHAKGRTMVWSRHILMMNLNGPTPEHLRFPATIWMPVPQP